MDIMPDPGKALTEDITSFFPNEQGIKVSMLRLDQVHPVVSGNKWFKLKHNMEAALNGGFSQLMTFGGAWSNHLVATAAAAANAGLKTVGIVRGFHAKDALTPTLLACSGYGMKLHFISRSDYDLKVDPEFLKRLQDQFGESYIIPEGGDNDAGRKGVGEIALMVPGDTTTVCVPVGTGTTFAGIRNELQEHIKMIGFTAMKGGDYLVLQISVHLNIPNAVNWTLNPDYAFKGFAKTTPGLIEFMQRFYHATGIPLDIVYTGKMLFGIQDLIQRRAFAEGENILCIHTGGLQGNPPALYLPL